MSVFYSEAILSRRGPLARVWLAAHYERKLSKTQTLQTDIGQSVGAIVGQEQVPMALRLSGQLLLGVVRIYSRKAKYLLDDCNEAIVKIKLAFRPGVVDLTEDQLAASRAAITLDTEGFDAEFMPQDTDWDLQPVGKQHIARKNDITLASANFMDVGFDGNAFDFGDGIGAEDWAIDTGLTFGDEENEPREADETVSIEIGRRGEETGSPRISIASNLRGDAAVDRDMSVFSKGADAHFDMGGPVDFGLNDNDINFGDADPGLTFGDEPQREATPGQVRDSRASTPQTPPPATPPPESALASLPTPTPRTAVRIAKLADQQDSTAKKKKTAKKQIVDSVTELQDGPGARGKRGLGQWKDPDVSEITTEQRFLPRSRVVMRLLEIQTDPLAHFMPTKTTPDGTFFCAGPPGLAPELTTMFMFPVRDLRRGRPIDGADVNPRSPKKPRTENENDTTIQLGRGGSEAPFDMSHDVGRAGTAGLDNTADFGLADFTFDGAGEPMDLDMPDIQLDLDKAVRQQRHRSVSRLVDDTRSTPGVADDIGMEAYDSQSCTIGLFDIRSSRDSKGDTQTQTQEAEDIERSTEQVQSKGYSKNTVKAIAVVRKGLEAEPEEDKYLSFNKISENASRRAACAFFFELLVLSTRDCVKITQSGSFENIEIRPKDKLYESLSTGAPPVSV